MASIRDLERRAMATRRQTDKLIVEALAILLRVRRLRRDLREEISLEIAKLEMQKKLIVFREPEPQQPAGVGP